MNTTISDKSILLSKKGMKEIKKAIIQLEHDKQNVLQSLRELDKTLDRDGSLSRIETISQLENIESELADKKLVLTNAKLIPATRTRLQVVIGSVVDLIDKSGHFFRYTIVDSAEANPSDGRISTLSPLGQCLVGRTVSETVKLNNGSKTNQFQLIRIT